MHPSTILQIGVVLAIAIGSGPGCANHVRFVESETDHSKRDVVDRVFGVSGQEGIVEDPNISLAFFKQEVVETRTRKIVTKREEFTPYSGGRESFEVPAGIVSLPLSFTFNLIDVLLFGYIPNDIVYGYTHWTFAALNPALNTENAARIESRIVEENDEDTGSARETLREALAGARVQVSLDDGEPQWLEADASGTVRIPLLDLVPWNVKLPPRRLRVALPGSDDASALAIEEALYLDRALALRLFRAAPLLALAASEGATPEELSRAIYALDALGFRRRSAELQDALFVRWADAPAALATLQSELDGLYTARPDIADVLAVPAAPAATPTRP